MKDEEFLGLIKWLMVLNEDDATWLLTSTDSLDLAHARSTLRATAERIDRELERRRV